MNRAQLVLQIASGHPSLTRKDVLDSVSLIVDAIVSELVAGGRVEIRGFGVFSGHYRRPRNGRNPRTGALVSIPRKYVVHFKPGRELAYRVIAAAMPTQSSVNLSHTVIEIPSFIEDLQPVVEQDASRASPKR